MGQFDKFKTNIYAPTFNYTLVQARSAAMREPSVIDEFYFRSIKNSDRKGVNIEFVCDPIIELLNQKRIENTIGTDSLKVWLNTLSQQAHDPFADLRKNCSDDDLISLIKSRYLQAPCEILAWSKYMSENLESFKKEVSLLRQKQAEEAQASVTGQSTEQTASVNGVNS